MRSGFSRGSERGVPEPGEPVRAGRLSTRPVLPFSIYGRSKSSLPFPLREEGCRLYARARHGIYNGVRALGLQPNDSVLVPAYHHGSEIEALERAGLSCVFYGGTDMLEPDEKELDTLLQENRSIRMLMVIHYLGFPQDAERWQTWSDRRGLLLFEDAAQAFLAERDGRPVGSWGDAAVFCLYKTFGIIDGAALISRQPPEPVTTKGRVRFAQTIRRHGAWVAQGSPVLGSLRARVPATPYSIQRDFALGDPNRPPAWTSRRVMARAIDPIAAETRRHNYVLLLDELGAAVPSPWQSVPQGSSPFVFPVEVENKGAAIEALARERVIAMNLWSVPHPSLPTENFDLARRLRARVLALPVHQDLGEDRVRYIAQVARRALSPLSGTLRARS